jgi:hypothetical protein
MERNGIHILFYCLSILKRRGTKLMVSDGMRRNIFHSSSIIIFQIQKMKYYYISFCSSSFHYISSIQIEPLELFF